MITKVDLATAVGFNAKAAFQNIQDVHLGMHVLNVSTKTELGVDEFIVYPQQRRTAQAAAIA